MFGPERFGRQDRVGNRIEPPRLNGETNTLPGTVGVSQYLDYTHVVRGDIYEQVRFCGAALQNLRQVSNGGSGAEKQLGASTGGHDLTLEKIGNAVCQANLFRSIQMPLLDEGQQFFGNAERVVAVHIFGAIKQAHALPLLVLAYLGGDPLAVLSWSSAAGRQLLPHLVQGNNNALNRRLA